MRRFIVTIGLLLALGILAATLVLFRGQQPAPPVALTVPAAEPHPTLPQPPSPQAVAPVATMPARGPCSPPTGWIRYIIFPGDTAEQLARRTGTPLDHILRANGCRSASDFYAGDEIFLPRRPAPRQEGVVASASETPPPDSPPPHAQPSTPREAMQPTRFAATPTPTMPEALGHAPQPSATSTATATLPQALSQPPQPGGELDVSVNPLDGAPGTDFYVTVHNAGAGEPLTLRVTVQDSGVALHVREMTADDMGSAMFVITAGAWQPGDVVFTVIGMDGRYSDATATISQGAEAPSLATKGAVTSTLTLTPTIEVSTTVTTPPHQAQGTTTPITHDVTSSITGTLEQAPSVSTPVTATAPAAHEVDATESPWPTATQSALTPEPAGDMPTATPTAPAGQPDSDTATATAEEKEDGVAPPTSPSPPANNGDKQSAPSATAPSAPANPASPEQLAPSEQELPATDTPTPKPTATTAAAIPAPPSPTATPAQLPSPLDH